MFGSVVRGRYDLAQLIKRCARRRVRGVQAAKHGKIKAHRLALARRLGRGVVESESVRRYDTIIAVAAWQRRRA